MIHADIRTSILITMGLVFIAQVFFNPVLLSAIFALILLCLFFSLKDQSIDFNKPYVLEIPLEPIDIGSTV